MAPGVLVPAVLRKKHSAKHLEAFDGGRSGMVGLQSLSGRRGDFEVFLEVV